MSATQSQTLNQRRQHFIRSIRNMQLQNFRKKHRQTLINMINPIAEVHAIKNSLTEFNIQYFSFQIAEVHLVVSQIIAKIRNRVSDAEFIHQMRSCYLLEQLYEVIFEDLSKKTYLDAPKLVEALLTFTYQLLSQGDTVLGLVENSFNYFVFALYRYPQHNKVLESVAGFFSYTELFFTNNYWQQRYQYNKKVGQQFLIPNLIQIYLSQPCYEILWGQSQFAECCDQGTQKWYKNAIMMLEIVNSLIMMTHARQKIVQINTFKEGLFSGIRVYAQHLTNLSNVFSEEEDSDFDAMSQSTHESHGKYQKNDRQNYFILLILDLLSMRNDLLSNQQSQLLTKTLEMTLNKSSQNHNICIISVKIIKILYQQVILDDEDLQSIGQRYPSVSSFLKNIINDFI